MNYLGHLFLSNDDWDLMICNLHGEYIKGKGYAHFDPIIRKGIELHRAIDYFTDNHPENLKLKQYCYQKLPKVSGVAIDIFYDHLLSINWKMYHHMNLSEFLDVFFNFSSKHEKYMHPEFIQFLKNLRQFQWIRHYGSEWGLNKMCQGVSQKLSFPNALMDAASFYKENKDKIESSFNIFIVDAIREFKS